MKHTNLMARAGLSFIFCAVMAIPQAANAQTPFPSARNYDVHALTLNGANCRVNDIDRGTAVGYCGESPRRAFAWTEATGAIDLGTLGGTMSAAWGVRNGRVVGHSTISGDLEEHAFAWTLETGLIDLGSLGGRWAYASAVSGRVAVGTAAVDEQPRAFRWRPATGIVALPMLPGGTQSAAYGIDGNLIAGFSGTSVPGRRPIIWRANGTLIDPIGGPLVSCGYFVCGDGEATAVRDGWVVGHRRDAAELSRAFAWTEAGGLVDLGLVTGSTESFAFDTDGGWAVGQLSGPLLTRAFLWTPAQGIKAITPSEVQAVATSVANRRVVGWYSVPDGNGSRVFRWTARRGPVDVTPPGMFGSRPMGIDGQGRIAVLYEDESPSNMRSVVLVPRDL